MADTEVLADARLEIARLSLFDDFSLSPTTLAGGCNWVHRLRPVDQDDGRQYEDEHATLCLRIPKDVDMMPVFVRGVTLQQEFVRRSKTAFVPAVIYAGQKFNITEWVDGNSISSWYGFRQDRQCRLRALEGIANFLVSSWSTTMTTYGDELTYRHWLITAVDRCFRRTLTQSGYPWGDPIHSLSRLAAVDDLARDSFHDHAMFLKHGDLHEGNILVNASGELRGVIDWDLATLAALAAAVHYPGFLANIPGWTTPGRPDDFDFADDRDYLLDIVKAQLAKDTKLLNRILQLLEPSFERQFFELSLIIKKVNFEYIRMRSTTEATTRYEPMLMGHLEAFLERNQDLKDTVGVDALRLQLQTKDYISGSGRSEAIVKE